MHETDIDINNHTNNISYIVWLLESLPAEYHETVSLAELEINYLAETMLDDRIETGWVGGSGDEVLHVIRRADDNREIVRARSHWVKRA